MMILGFFANILIFGMAIFVIKKLFFRTHKQTSKGGGVRRFFQYGLLFALTIISSVGTAGLLGRLIHIGTSLSSDRAALALDTSFVVVGIPLLLLVAMWTRRTIAKDPDEKETLGWNLYLAATSILALCVNLDAQLKIYKVIFADGILQGGAIAQFVIWGGVWFIHYKLLGRIRLSLNAIGDELIGSLIGLGFSVFGLSQILQSLLSALFQLNQGAVIVAGNQSLIDGLMSFIVGAPVWYVYWIQTSMKNKKESNWFAYVLLVGVGSALLVVITSASLSLYSALIWLFGDPTSQSASEHFKDFPQSLATFLVGLIVMWYHRNLLSRENATERTNVRRIYEYGIAGIGLIAAAGGVTMILVSIIQSLSKSTQLSGTGSINSLLAAFTLIIVGGPIWWFIWNSIQIKAKENPKLEHSSLIRRIYLLILFGALGVVSVAMLVLGAYFIFKDLFQGGVGLETLRRMRFPLAILLTTAFVSSYHWMIFRGEKDTEVRRSSNKRDQEKRYFFVEITIKPGKVDEYLAEFNRYIHDVRKERGCEKIDLLVDPKIKNTVYLYEIWSDTSTHQAHLNSEGFAAWKEFSDPLTAHFSARTLDSAEI